MANSKKINTPSSTIFTEKSIDKKAIEDGFPIEFISDIAELESYRKEVNRPIYHIHKWWAQRLGSVFRSIILGSALPIGTDMREAYYEPISLPNLTVFDPFMGSGTTIGEALKLGCKAIGRDINPVSSFLVKNAFGDYALKDVEEAFSNITKDVSGEIKKYYKAQGRDEKLHDVLYYFWVMYVECPQCKKPVDLFTSYIFSRHAYPKKHPESKAVCPSCGDIVQCMHDDSKLTCKKCRHKFNPQSGTVTRTNATCSSCSFTFPVAKAISAKTHSPSFRMYAKMIIAEDGTKEYHPIDDFDEKLYTKASKVLSKRQNPFPIVALKPGYNTNQVLNYNYHYWHQMFNERQLLCLSLLAESINKIKNEPLRKLFTCHFSGCLEFNNMFASFKGEGTGAVRHMFSHHILKPERTPLEANLWGTEKSSGSFSTLFKSRLLRAIEYRNNPFEQRVIKLKDKLSGDKVFGLSATIGTQKIASNYEEMQTKGLSSYISCGDSSKTDLPDKCIDLVITDPPFFDNVHYSELADFFYVWIRHLSGERGIFKKITTRVEGEVQNVNERLFANNLTAVFVECHRVLSDDGLMVFSYHHSKHEGWSSILEAIVKSGFYISATHPVKSEMSVAMPKSQAKEPIDLDILIVCRKRQEACLFNIGQVNIKQAFSLTEKQVFRFSNAGRKLSRNDVRVIYMGQVIAILSRIDNLSEASISLVNTKEQIALDIEKIYAEHEITRQPIDDMVSTGINPMA